MDAATQTVDKSSGSVYSWLKTVPASDNNFQEQLKTADIATIQAVLADLPQKNSVTKRNILESRLKSLSKNLPKTTKITQSPQNLSDEITLIEVSRIIESPFEPQARRRKRYKKEAIEELGESIIKHKLKQPILVRPIRVLDARKFDYEIVFGERRWLAHKAKGLPKIKCFVENLSNAEVAELQYEENHRRQESNPLDDAFWFQFLMKEEGYNEDQLADRFNLAKKDVTLRLRLNKLIPEAVQQFEDEKLPLKHCQYLATFPPESQKVIVEKSYAYKYFDINDGPVPYNEFKDRVGEKIVRLLCDAVFDPEDERLHLHKLKCSFCTERSGYSPALFPELKEKDSCLNPKCFESKTNVHLKLKREDIAVHYAKPGDFIDEAVKKVPVVTQKEWSPVSPFKEKVELKQQIYPEPECSFSTLALDIDRGAEVWICKSNECPIHHPKKPAKTVNEADLIKLEQQFNRKVVLEVRQRIFGAAIEFFDDNKPFWMFDDLVCRLLSELWWNTGTDTRKLIGDIIKDWKNHPKDLYDHEQVGKFISSLTKRRQTQLLFLLTFHTEGYFTNSSQSGVKKICSDYTKLDYKIVDAVARVDLAPAEFKEAAQEYLNKVRETGEGEPPKFWTREIEVDE